MTENQGLIGSLPSSPPPASDASRPAAARAARRITREAQARLTSPAGLDIFVEPNAAGELARKLIVIEPGSYSFLSELDIGKGTGDITAGIECASYQSARALTTSLVTTKDWQFDSPECDYASLILKGSAWESSLPLEATLKLLVLERQ